ncbi:MAG: hypothetical protein QW292_07860 [Candidatus Parvarchaeota archaeon]
MSLASMVENMKDIMLIYAARGKTVIAILNFKSETGKTIGRIMKLDELITKKCTHRCKLKKSLKCLRQDQQKYHRCKGTKRSIPFAESYFYHSKDDYIYN